MKLYKPEPLELVRIAISKSGENKVYLTLCETNMNEVLLFVTDLINKSPLVPKIPTGSRVRVDIREALGAKNGKSKSISFFGLSVKQVEELIINN